MIICPFCHFQNEDGALFCEQCKSDLSSVASTPPAPVVPVVPVVEPVAEVVPVEAVPVVPVVEAEPIAAAAVSAEPIAAEPIPVEAVPAVPVAPEPPPPPPAPVMEAPPPPPPAPAAAAPVPPPPAPAPAPAPAAGAELPEGAEPKLVVLRGQKRNAEYPIYGGQNFIGRADEKPVDIDLEDQEPPDRVWCSRQHAVITFENAKLLLEDLNSSNGTYLNRARVYPGQPQPLKPNDVIQIGNVQLKVVV